MEVTKTPPNNSIHPQWEPISSNYRFTPHILTPDRRIMDEVKQTKSKISGQRDLITELHDKLRYQNGEIITVAGTISKQKKVLRGVRRQKHNLQRTLTKQRKQNKEKNTYYLDFLKPLSQESNFPDDMTCGEQELPLNTAEQASMREAMASETEINFETELKILSFELISKLEKIIDNEKVRKREMNELKTNLEDNKIDVHNFNAKSTVQAKDMTSENSQHVITYKEPPKLRLKRVNYRYQVEDQIDPVNKKFMVSTNCESLSAKENNNDILENVANNIESSQIRGATSITVPEQVMDTSDLFHYTSNLKFATKVGLNDHTNIIVKANFGKEKRFRNKLLKKLNLKNHC